MFDFLVVGGGIAGASVAYFLSRFGKRVVVADDTAFCSSASLAAGAFINPVMGKPSAFKNFADQAFRFSTLFYEERFGELFKTRGSIVYPKNEKTKEEFAAIGEYIPSPYNFLEGSPFAGLREDGFSMGAFFVKDTGVIDPKALIEAMLDGCERANARISEISFDGSAWDVDGIKAKNIILAQGANPSLSKEPYIDSQLSSLWGQKIKIKSNLSLPITVSSDIHIASKGDISAIGATHINSKEPLAITKEVSVSLVAKALKIADIREYEIVEESGGMRSASIDHFPLCGAVYDAQKNIERFPSLMHGARLSKEEPIRRPNLYIHTGHGSRAFMLAPYTANILANHILRQEPIPKSIDPARLLFRYFKKRLAQN